MNNLANTLSQLIKQRGLSTAELARQTGVAQPVIYRLMVGTTENPQIMSLKPIADYFSISVDQLMGYKALTENEPLNKATLHDVQNKLAAIKTVASALIDIVPHLRDGYKTAVHAQLMKEAVSIELLPIIELNILNVIKSADAVATSLNIQQSGNRE
jgi:transcriptional regulator with XRE-family HTH domain